MKRNLNTTVLQLIMSVSLLLLVLQLWNMQFNLADKYKEDAKHTATQDIYTPADRGIIYDRNGAQLVRNEARWAIAVTRPDLPSGSDLYLIPYYLPTDPAARPAVFDRIATLVNRPDIIAATIARLVAATDPQRPYQPILLATGLDSAALKAIANASDLPALWTAPASKRVFDGLGQIVAAPTVVYLIPQELPATKQGVDSVPDEVGRQRVYSNTATLLTPFGGPDGATIAGKLGEAVSPDRPALLFSGLNDVTAENFRRNAAALPGIHIGSELEYNYLRAYSAASLNPVIVKSNVSEDIVMKVETKSRDLPGSSIVSEPVRVYADGPTYAHLIGYTGRISDDELAKNPPPIDSAHPELPIAPIYLAGDKVGQVGLEATLEQQLRGSKGVKEMAVDNGGDPTSLVGQIPPLMGNNVYLTVDSGLQKAVTAALQKGISEAGVTSGVAIVEDVHSGQILAMVSLPSYDNNLFATGISQTDFDKLNNDTNLPMYNRAIAGLYPPGSTFKIIMASAGLQTGVINTTKTYNCPGTLRVPYTADNTKFNNYTCWKLSGHGNLNVIQAIGDSCDGFFYNLGGPRQEDGAGDYTRYFAPGASKPVYFDGLGIDRINEYAHYFGLGQKTGIELSGELDGLVPDRNWKLQNFNDDWALGDTLISSIGQGYDLVTPIQLANATTAIANGGTLYQPTLVYQIKSGDGSSMVQPFQPKVLGQVPVSADNLAVVRQGMRLAVTGGMGVSGTSHHVNYTSLAVAGKTGTAEFGDPNPITHYRPSHAWFTSFAPYDNPQIAVTVFLQGGAGNGRVDSRQLEGGVVAVPVAAEIYKYYFNLSETVK